MDRHFLSIVFFMAVCTLTACSGSSTSSDDPEQEGNAEWSSDSFSENGSSGVVILDSLGRPVSSSGKGHSSTSQSSSSVGSVPVIEDSLIVDTTVVSDVSDLPKCTSANEGESFMVERENAMYFCLGEKWVDFESAVETSTVSCRNGVLVVGEVDEEEENSSNSNSQFPWGNFGGGTVNTAAVDTAEPRMVGARVVGVAEKGPFRYGTSVKLIELDSTQHLADSKRSHKTCILDANGNFSFDSVDFVSPYLRVQANGFFRNELTSGLSASVVTLEAVVDVTEKDSVNVNMLTHMEAPRVLKLVETAATISRSVRSRRRPCVIS